jgi:CBS domain-containing protein
MNTSERHRGLGDISVAEAMSDRIVSLPRTAPLSRAAELMAGEHIHCVVVSEEPNGSEPRFWGVVSDLDLVAAATVRDLDQQTAGGSAATGVVTVRADDSLLRAGQLMTEHATAHVVVVDEVDGSPIGVLSTLDLAAALGGRTHDLALERDACNASP